MTRTHMLITQMKQQLEQFKSHLEKFAIQYAADVRKDPAFRRQFQQMCANIGVDPLASNKGFWAELLGIGDFYYELGVQIVEICMHTRAENGGLMDVTDLTQRLTVLRKGSVRKEISADDVSRAVATLKPLGSGFKVVKMGTRTLVQSVPKELNSDHTALLEYLQEKGKSAEELSAVLKWQPVRVETAINQLLLDGICWEDQHQTTSYWVMAFK